jgi:hypothetical protein
MTNVTTNNVIAHFLEPNQAVIIVIKHKVKIDAIICIPSAS